MKFGLPLKIVWFEFALDVDPSVLGKLCIGEGVESDGCRHAARVQLDGLS